MGRFTEQLIRYRWWSLALVALVTLGAISQVPNLRIDNSNETFFLEGDPTQERLDAFRDTFGNDDFVFVLVEVEDAFASDTLNPLAELADRLELEVPHLLDLTWAGNVEWIEGVPGGIERIGGIWTATKLIMETPTRKSRTLMHYTKVRYNIGLAEAEFDQSALKR